MTSDASSELYCDPAIVAYYDRREDLDNAEKLLFETYLEKGMEILDVGVGAGRTTPYLAAIAARYVGIDYAEAMIARCVQKFPTLRFLKLDATDMSVFRDGSFDAVIFSFNGIDSIPTGAMRARCLQECARVLRRGGVMILSAHNARYLLFAPILDGVGVVKGIWRIAYAGMHTVRNLLRRITSGSFWRGDGYLLDPFWRPPCMIHVSTRERFAAELWQAGLRVVRIVGADYPGIRSILATPWYYYACIKGRSQ